MNWLVVGAGDVARKRVFPAIAAEPRSRLYGVVTRNPAKLQPHAIHVWQELSDALADPAIDAVYIATPVFLHHPQTLAALSAGKHVLCEKPFSITYDKALEMVNAAKMGGHLLGVAYFRRLYPKLVRAKQLLAAGSIGRPVLALAVCSEWFPFETGDGRTWAMDPRHAGSGPLYDSGSHRLDVLNFLLGQPLTVTPKLSNVVRQMAVEDCATLIIDYESGARAVLDARWNTRALLDDLRIIGTDGEMDLSPLNGPDLRYPGGKESLPSMSNRHYACIENFVSAVLGRTPLACDAEASLPTAWALHEAIRSGRT